MKATRYFSDYQSAYNYYGGNVVPSTEIALIGDGSYIFVSSDNAVSGNQQYFDVSMTNDEIVDTMTYTAYNNGVSYGEAVGFETGYTAGTTYGEAIGYAQGYSAGVEAGYDSGYTAGVDSVPTPTGNVDITNTSQYNVTAYATAQVVDANLISTNIVSGTTILGVTGSYTGLVPSGTAYINANTVTDVTTYAYAYCTASGDETLLNTVAYQASQNGFMKECIPPIIYDAGNIDNGFDTVTYDDDCLVDGLIDCTPYVDTFTENGVEHSHIIISNDLTGFPAHVTVSLNNGDKVGIGLYKNTWEEDPETGDEYVTGTYIYWLVGDTSDENTHWLTAEDGNGNYKFEWDEEVDPQSGDTTGVTFSFSKVNS